MPSLPAQITANPKGSAEMRKIMNSTTLGLLLVIISYLALMIVIGFLYSKKNNDVKDFYLGGRKLGPLVTAMSAEASDMSSWLLMGLPGLAYIGGIADPADRKSVV